MKVPQDIYIGSKTIGKGQPVFIIAEAGINHNGDLALAKKLVDAAKNAGADSVKFQTFRAEEEVTKTLNKVEYQKEGTTDQESYYDMIKKLEFSVSQWQELMQYCEQVGILFISTPSEEVSARLLHKLGVPGFKIGSNDLVTTPMLAEIAQWHKPMILSTGMATPDEIEETLGVVTGEGNDDIILLHCTSSYPTPSENINLLAMQTLEKTFGVLVGFSDHSAGIVAAPLAVLLGATVIETHLTLDKNLPGPDQRMALDPQEFSALVAAIRKAELLKTEDERSAAIAATPGAKILLGDPEKKPTDAELLMRIPTRKSIVARRPIKEGEIIDSSMLAYKRPYKGLPARAYRSVIGKKAATNIEMDEHIKEEMLV